VKELSSLVKNGALFQGVLVIMVGGTVCFVAAQGQTVPEVLTAAFGMIIGYFFATRVRSNTNNGIEAYLRSLGLEKRVEDEE